MHNYYFVAPSLPPLILGERPEITFEELMYRLQLNLSKEDLEKVATIRRMIDLQNIRDLYLQKPLDPRGNLNEKELDEALLIQDFLPEYVFDFLGQFEETKEKARHYSGLLARYFREEIEKSTGFLKNFLVFERELRLVLTALRAKKLHRDLARELQFEDFTDPMVAHILAQKDIEDYVPPLEFQDLKEQLQLHENNPWEQYRIIMKYEFDHIDEMTGYPLFSLDWILGYVARLLLVEKWLELDEIQAKEVLERYKNG